MASKNQLSEESLRLLLNAGFNEQEQTIWSAIMWIKDTFGLWITVNSETEGAHWYPNINICTNKSWGAPLFRAAYFRANEVLRTKWIKTPEEAYNTAITTLLNQFIYGE